MKKNTIIQAMLLILTCVISLNNLQSQTQDFIWSKGFGSDGIDLGTYVVVDSSGNVYTVGIFQNTIDFDPSSGIANLSSNGFNDIFIQKLDANGNFIWAKSIGGIGVDIVNSITVDNFGYLYITGAFQLTVDFDPNSGITNVNSVGDLDIFVEKLDVNGNFIWVKTMKTEKSSNLYNPNIYNYGVSIIADDSGNVYTAGFFQKTVDFDPSTVGETNLTSSGIFSTFIQKLDSNGNFIWAKAIGGQARTFVGANSITVDNFENVYMAGSFAGTVDFNPASGDRFNLTSDGTSAFIQKLDSSGNFIWAKATVGISLSSAFSITLDNSANVYTTGIFSNTVDFNPDTGSVEIFNLTSKGGQDIFIQKLDTAGNFVWAKAIGGIKNDQGRFIKLDSYGNIYTTGYFANTVDFNPASADIFNITSNGGNDIFIQKLDTNGNFIWAKAIGGSYGDSAISMTIDNLENIYVTGSFRDTVDFDPGLGTVNLSSDGGSQNIFILKLGNIYYDTVKTLLCAESYIWNGITYHISGDYFGTFTNVNNQDSVVRLNLKINPTYGVIDEQKVCESPYTWINGKTYTFSSDTAKYTFLSVDNCDSVVTLDLTITIIDDSVTNKNGVLSAFETGATYQWVSCDFFNTPVSGQTNQNYKVKTAGNYAVIITKNNCIDTSDCENVTITGIGEIENNKDIIIYPNPINGEFTIEWNYDKKATISIINLKGQSIYQKTILGKRTKIQLPQNISNGIYNLKLQSDNAIINEKIYIQKN